MEVGERLANDCTGRSLAARRSTESWLEPGGTGGCLVAEETKGNKTECRRRKARGKKQKKEDNKKMRSSGARKRSSRHEGERCEIATDRKRKTQVKETRKGRKIEAREIKRFVVKSSTPISFYSGSLGFSNANDILYLFQRL